MLGPTFDYTQRLLDFALPRGERSAPPAAPASASSEPPGSAGDGAELPNALASLIDEGLIAPCAPTTLSTCAASCRRRTRWSCSSPVPGTRGCA